MTTSVRVQEPDVRRHELAEFLRSRRERVVPEQVGLPRGRRRRTPGLRREEVAHLSAVGVTWYTWLEQARDIQVSAQVLDAVARTLLLDNSERAHLFSLAGAIDPVPGTPCLTITPALGQMVTQLDPFPACIQNSRYDILAYNPAYGSLMCDLDAVAPEDRNCLWLAFTNDDWRASIANREESSRMMTARFRADMAEHLTDPAWKTLLSRLQAASPEFCAIWERHEVVGTAAKTKKFLNAKVGVLNMQQTSLWLGPRNGPRLVSYVPVDEEARKGLDELQAWTRANSKR
jgi:hypothetical protein